MAKSKKETDDNGSDPIETAMKRVSRTTCTGDIRDFLLNQLKFDKSPLPWSAQPEAKQQETIEHATRAAENLVRRVVEIVAADGRRTIQATLEQFNIKSGVKATIKLDDSDETLLALNHARGEPLKIVVADTATYTGERRPAKSSPDQKSMLGDDDKDGEGAA